MTNEFYKNIAKHVFVAWFTYSTDCDVYVVLADNIEEARSKMKELFPCRFISVKAIEPTEIDQVYEG